MSLGSFSSGSDIEILEKQETIKLFYKPYYPEVQTVQIAINLKGKIRDLEKV